MRLMLEERTGMSSSTLEVPALAAVPMTEVEARGIAAAGRHAFEAAVRGALEARSGRQVRADYSPAGAPFAVGTTGFRLADPGPEDAELLGQLLGLSPFLARASYWSIADHEIGWTSAILNAAGQHDTARKIMDRGAL